MPQAWHARDRISEDYLPHCAVRVVRLAARYLPAAVVANSRSTRDKLRYGKKPTAVIGSPVVYDAVPRSVKHSTTPNRPFVVGCAGRSEDGDGCEDRRVPVEQEAAVEQADAQAHGLSRAPRACSSGSRASRSARTTSGSVA